ncbi:unnamed protein product [Fraxinus pennsylvanica]|uniref:Uncharacterized protein n=1 Tax=Fraxinus pennsylvanica TaxID=56036 RepID=A0AAD1ZXJ9_9LAMI|nr:unnamed protein product [Fraxinus pennsylvanica]
MAATFAVPAPKSSILENPLASRELNTGFVSGLPLKGLCFQLKPRKNRGGNDVTLVVSAASSTVSGSDGGGGGRFYFNFTGFPFPLGPFLNRRTIRYEVSFVIGTIPLRLRCVLLLIYLNILNSLG